MKEEKKCTCPFDDETAAEVGHNLDCPQVSIDTRWKHELKSIDEKINPPQYEQTK